jgi:hypothetical protein
MSAIEWLCARAHGFEELRPEERDAIMHFSLLWSYFEARVLDHCASARRIVDLARYWGGRDQLNDAALDHNLSYFRQRYFRGGTATRDFDDLRFRKNDKRDLVEAVLKGENTNLSDCIAALLIIVFRLRNNLFHGSKWDYGLYGQFDNFTHANEVLMRALDLTDQA